MESAKLSYVPSVDIGNAVGQAIVFCGLLGWAFRPRNFDEKPRRPDASRARKQAVASSIDTRLATACSRARLADFSTLSTDRGFLARFTTRWLRILLAALLLAPLYAVAQQSPRIYAGGHGPGKGKHVVLIAGDQEYRAEESVPALAQILATRHGFHCTVLFPINRQTGKIDPNTIDNIPGLEALRKADLLVLFARWLELPDEQMKEIVDYTDSGRPIVALRTSTHPFNYQKHPESPYAKYSYNNKQWPGGYGRQVLGETWIAHYGAHQKQSTRGVIAAGMERHPILRGVHDLWGESDVYEITTLSGDSKPLVMGQVLMGMEPTAAPDPSKKLMPVAWTKTYTGAAGKPSRIFTTTMGHAMDFRNTGFRRMLVNACYWAAGLEKKITATGSVEFADPYNPHPIGVRRPAP